MSTMSIQNWYALDEKLRPQIRFHGDPVTKVTTDDYMDFTIEADGFEYKRDFACPVEIEPIPLQPEEAISLNEFAKLAVSASELWKGDVITCEGEIFPATILLSGCNLLFLVAAGSDILGYVRKS